MEEEEEKFDTMTHATFQDYIHDCIEKKLRT